MPHGALGLFVSLVLSMLVAPFAAAQQPANVPRIGYLNPRRATSPPELGFKAFLQGLHTLGYVEGQNVVIEYRRAEGKENRLSEFAAELVRLKVDVLFAASSIAVRGGWHATRTIPIVGF